MQPDVHNTRKRGKALQPALMELLVMEDSGIQYECARYLLNNSGLKAHALAGCYDGGQLA
jgi:hypothetical protein